MSATPRPSVRKMSAAELETLRADLAGRSNLSLKQALFKGVIEREIARRTPYVRSAELGPSAAPACAAWLDSPIQGRRDFARAQAARLALGQPPYLRPHDNTASESLSALARDMAPQLEFDPIERNPGLAERFAGGQEQGHVPGADRYAVPFYRRSASRFTAMIATLVRPPPPRK